MGREFRGQRAREGLHPALGSSVGAGRGLGKLRVNGRDVHDASPAPLLDHLPGGCLRTQKTTGEVVGENLAPLRFRHIHRLRLENDSRVVDQNIQAAPLLQYRTQHAINVGSGRHIGGDGESLSALFPDFIGNAVSAVLVQVSHHHLRAFLRQHEADGLADS